MKKINFKKAMAAVAAMSMVACAAAIPASAAADGVTLSIDQVTISLEDLQAQNYQVPIYVRLDENAGVNAAEFGVQVDERCSFEVVTNIMDAMNKGGEMVVWSMTYSISENAPLAWLTWANSAADKTAGAAIVLFMVTVPEDAQPGDLYAIDYVEENTKLNIWNNTADGVNHVENDTVDTTNGWIQIEMVETEPETVPETEPETVPETEPETVLVTDAPATEAPTQAPTAAPESSTASPATGSADVLPIVGAAAAIAVLGGVAMVSKKKD